MLGKGIHFSSLSSKSAQYCYHSISNNEGLILICEVDLGREYKLEAPQVSFSSLSITIRFDFADLSSVLRSLKI